MQKALGEEHLSALVDMNNLVNLLNILELDFHSVFQVLSSDSICSSSLEPLSFVNS
jgi:hypothetical protein